MRTTCLALSLGTILWGIAAMAQEDGLPAVPPPSTMQMTIVGTSLKASDGKIYVNEKCELFPGLTFPIKSHKPEGEWIPDVCHLENVEQSERHDEKAEGSELERADVEIHEQEYVLQNISLKPVVFAVLVQIPEGWSVDSDPKPLTVAGPTAIFEVHAGPWEKVRLHVGLRHTKELKPKRLPSEGSGGR